MLLVLGMLASNAVVAQDSAYGVNYAILSPGRTVYMSLAINFSK
ncbi:Hypothetical protein PSM36_1724 [Proteiniphilum saccharofermentans]|uniref:Uncharacterized protein n=2 Tax=Dysgonomonadaceae TaxID=2005520 RepID=A0A1R3SW82_9BACT|nr:Hypothetical protein PSM36_1724 [Proteiniphilum saccharofermentans]SFK80054.1 hypothetical protein SAMN05216357_10691 [Porphyromonadaceae bacterium KH3CP3RA]